MMSYVVVWRFTTTEDLSAGTYGSPEDLFLAITGYRHVRESFITNQENIGGILLDSDKRDSVLSTFENTSFVIVVDYVAVDQEMVFESEAHFDAFNDWHALQTFTPTEQFISTNTYQDTWTKTVISEG
jgi:hypothetical protein